MDKGQKKYMRYRYNLPLRFQEQIAMALNDKGMTQKELAKKSGLSAAIINSMCNGKPASLLNWAKVFTVLGIDVGFRDGSTKKSLDIGPP